MNIFKWIAQKLETVYCEDCVHSVPGDKNMFNIPRTQCRAYPIEVDTSSKTDYVTRKKKIVVHTYRWCESIRKTKSMPLIYSSTCHKFERKPLTSKKNVV